MSKYLQTKGSCSTREGVVLKRNVLLRVVNVTKPLMVNTMVRCAYIYIERERDQVLCGQFSNE